MDNIIKKDEYTLPFVSLEKSRDPCPICGNTMYHSEAGLCCFFCGYTPHVIKGEQNDKV